MSKTQIKWEDPAPDARGRGRWDAVAEALRANPGRWALIAEDVAATTTTAIHQGRLSAFRPAGTFEATARNVKKGRADIYCRYVGSDA